MSIAQEYAVAARRKLVARSINDPDVLRARADANHFCEWVFRDDQREGSPIIQAEHHRIWQGVVATQKRGVVWFPIEHGKTTQVKFSLCRLLGEHPDRQYGYLSSKKPQAVKMVTAVKNEIEGNIRLQKVFPNLRPQLQLLSAAREQWGTTAFKVEGCPRGTKDSSLTGYGLDSPILGARLHGVIIDGCLDSENTNSESLRKKVIEKFKDEIFGRVMEGGFILFLDTAWFHDDALHYYAKKKGWYSIKLDAETALTDGDETLWPAQFSRERLDEKRDTELGPTSYNRQFRNRPLSESMNVFKREYWDQALARVGWYEDLTPPDLIGLNLAAELRTGVDVATKPGEDHDLTAMCTVLASGHRRRLINLESGRIEGPAILKRMVSIYRRLHRPVNLAGGNAVFVVEDNAAQVYLVQMLKDAAILRAYGLTPDEVSDIRVIGRTTTANKRDQQLGVPMLAAGLEMGRWDIAVNQETENLRDEMEIWTPGLQHYGDRLMSMWFAASDLMETGAEFTVDYI